MRYDVLVATWLCVALALSCYVQVTQAETFIVGPSATYTHIQDAIGSAQPGDSILVLPATYLENLDFLGKSLVLISASGPMTTIIDGSTEDIATIRIINGEDSRTSIVGFTITGGRGYDGSPGLPRFGGGIAILNSSVSITGNTIKGNTALTPSSPSTSGFGGGVGFAGVGIVNLLANVITENVAGNSGGGVSTNGSQTSLTTLALNNIHGNICTFGDGGGVQAHPSGGHVDIRDNRISDNRAGDHGGGLYIASSRSQTNSTFSLERNIIADNVATSRSATYDAGGGCWVAGMNGPITSNTFARNVSVSASPNDGSGLAITAKSMVTIQFNLLALNRPGAGLICESTAQATLQHNLFWGNLPTDVSGSPCSEQIPGTNLLANPQFCDSLGPEFSLATTSPALEYPLGPIGAVTVAGCTGTTVVATTWSQIKRLAGHSGNLFFARHQTPRPMDLSTRRFPILFLSER